MEPRRTAVREGRRARQADRVDIVAFNSTGAPQLKEALKVIYERNKAVPKGGARTVAVLSQEHQTTGVKWADLQHEAQRVGWLLRGAQAAEGDKGGNSAGTAIALPPHIGASPPAGHAWDASPPESLGRLAAAWMDTGPRGGLAVISIYCWDCEGLTPRNKRLIAEAVRVGCILVIGGDFNCTPEEIAAEAQFLAKLGLTVSATNQATCFVGRRNIDFFLVDSRIAHAVDSVQVDLDVDGSHHNAVRLRINVPDSIYLVDRVRKPKEFPRERPIGCAPTPPTPDMQTITAARSSTAAARGPMDAAWRAVAAQIEQELCDMNGLVKGDGADPAYMGRASPAKVVKVPMLPPTSGNGGAGSNEARALRWIARRAKQIARASSDVAAGAQLAQAATRCFEDLSKKMRSPPPVVQGYLNGAGEKCKARLEAIGAHQLGGPALEDIVSWVDEAETATASLCKEQARQNAKSFRAWLDHHLKKGAGAIHAAVKREEAPALAPVTRGGEATLHAQDSSTMRGTAGRRSGSGRSIRPMHPGDDGDRAPRTIWTLSRQTSCARQRIHLTFAVVRDATILGRDGSPG